VVVRTLPAALGAVPTVAGAFFDSEGDPQLVLDPAGIVEMIRSGDTRLAPAALPVRPPVLVIDDSLTTRMLEQGILEAAGYEVDTAASGEEALQKARQRRYGVFIVDVEMPGISGFQFVEAARADARLSQVPAIVVTSRDAEQDRVEGQRVGAKAYIVKSRFDEALLLGTIRSLIG
jgi:two-component system chemotaxis sensor kinase CheA